MYVTFTKIPRTCRRAYCEHALVTSADHLLTLPYLLQPQISHAFRFEGRNSGHTIQLGFRPYFPPLGSDIPFLMSMGPELQQHMQ